MHFPLKLTLILIALTTFSYARTSLPTYHNNTIFQSPPDYTTPGTLYARTVLLTNGTLLATWENYSPEPPPVYFPIFASYDTGLTWTHISDVTAAGSPYPSYGLRYQPFLYLLPQDWSNWKAGTIFLAGNSIPTNLSSTHIELYASTDSGLTWTYVSLVASGGEAVPDNGLTPIWEPFLLLHNGELICFYSDQRQNNTYGQKLVHQTTSDGVNWNGVVNDVAFANYTQRPGMTTTAQLNSGQWIMTFEYGGGAVNGSYPLNYSFPVYYKIADDPTQFGSAEAVPLVAKDGQGEQVVPYSSPYVVVDKKSGMVIVSCGTLSPVFTTMTPENPSSWAVMETEERISYTRSLRIIESGGETGLLLAAGGLLPPSKGNKVTVGLIELSGW